MKTLFKRASTNDCKIVPLACSICFHSMERDVNRPNEDLLHVVNKCVESLEKLVNLKTSADRTLYVGSIEKLQLAVCSEDSAMTHFTSNYSGGIPLLISVLEKSQDQHIRHFAILIIEKMLLQNPGGNEHAQSFVEHGAVDHLLKLIVKCQLSWGDGFISSLYRITAKVAEEDKKFAVKARFLGVLPVIVSHIRTYAKRHKVLNAILKLLKKIMTSSVNSTKLSKDGLPRELLHFLDDPRKTITIPVLNAISEATRTRHAARQFVKDDLIPRVLNIIFSLNTSDCNRVNSIILKTCLRIIVHLTQIKIGREKLLSAGTISSLLSWCQTFLEIPGSRYGSLMTLVSTVVQRCLPSRPLPVRKLTNPVTFAFTEGSCHNESDSSDGRNDDTLSLASSTMSSVDSASESDEELRLLHAIECRYDDSIDNFASLFEELNDCMSVTNSFTSEDSPQVDEYHEHDTSNKTNLPQPTEEQKTTKQNSLLPKIIPHQSPIPMIRKESQIRRQRKSTSESSHSLREKHCRSASINCVPLCAETANMSSLKTSKRFSPSEHHHTICDSNIPSKNKLVHSVCRKTTSDYSDWRNQKSRIVMTENSDLSNQKYLELDGYGNAYVSLSSLTMSVCPFVKLAYPDTVKCLDCDSSELLKPDPFLIRHKLFKHTKQMAENDPFYTEIYNFDSLLNENYILSSTLCNNDYQRIYSEQCSDHLKFEARFESGNLRKVFWKGGLEYDLILNPDINSKSHVQWFYFEVSEMKAQNQYVFNLINMEKSTSQFNEGVCPVMFSVRNHVEKQEGWQRAGTNICYFRNHYTQSTTTNSSMRNKAFYTLTFTMSFPYTNDVCYIAYHYPYTYTTLQTHIYLHIQNYDASTVYFKKDELCKTLSQNSVPLLTITAKPLNTNRPYIFLTARVHPGESNSSWVMKGTLDFLLSNKAQRLREEFIFKIVPMLNPDGVINGCHRCSLSGQDLNRQWISPNVHCHPTIYYAKSLFHYLSSKNKKPLVFCDYHGHSRRSNAFFYGCNSVQSWWPADENKPYSESFKILPLLMQKMASTFSLNNCEFSIERNRESTGRVTVWRQFDVMLSYTLECSYGGCIEGKYAGYHMGIAHLEDTGKKLCECFGGLMFDSCSGRVESSVPLDVTSFPSSSFVKPSKSKVSASSTSTSTDEELEEYESNDIIT